MSKLLHTLKNIIYYFVVAFLSFIIIFSLVRPGELINVINVSWYKVVSKSMDPLIKVDDFIIAKKLDDTTKLVDGDIIIFETYFYHDGGYKKGVVTHHFSHVTEEGYIITYPHSQFNQVDKDFDTWFMSPSENYYVTEDDLIGKHIDTIPFSSFDSMVNYLFTRPLGIAVTITIFILIGHNVIYILKQQKPKYVEKAEEIAEDELAYIFGSRNE